MQEDSPCKGLRLSDAVIEQAVRETLAESRAPRSASGKALSRERYQEFSRQFSDAKKPGCLAPDALKFQPASVTAGGWNIGIGGLLALPLWAAALARGKCN